MEVSSNYSKISGIIYFSMLMVLISPVWLLDFFHTGDGPAHLYAAKVLGSLISDKASFYNDFFQINYAFVPNSVVQIILTILMLFFNSAIATKILATLIMLVFVFGYRALLKELSGGNNNFPVLIMLLVYAYPLRMGFYSFLLGLGVMMFVFAYYINHYKISRLKSTFILSGLLLLIWFCHLFAIVALLLFMLIYEANIFLFRIIQKESIKDFGRTIPLKLLSVIPVALISFFFYQAARDISIIKYIDISILRSWFLEMNVMFNFGTDKEFYIRKIFKILLLSGIIYFIVNSKRINWVNISFLTSTAFIFTLLYFFMPANYFSGGSINLRLAYVVMIVLCIFIDLMIIDNVKGLIKMIIVAVGVCLASVNEVETMKKYSDEIVELNASTDQIIKEGVVLPLNYHTDNLQYNFLLYLACDRDVLVLDNAEAGTPNSLVTWKENVWKPRLIGNYLESNTPLIHPGYYEEKTNVKIDYIVRWYWNAGIYDTATLQTNAFIDSLYLLTYRSPTGKVIVSRRMRHYEK